MTPCAVVPVYNHHEQLGRVIGALRANELAIVIVDDGSNATTATEIAEIAARHEHVHVITQTANEGKGTAVLAGLAKADALGYTHALQIDADGQHDTADIPALLKLASRYPTDLISGLPKFDETIPGTRFYGRYLTHGLVWCATLSRQLCDSMCGFRVYPVAATLELAVRAPIGRRMDFDTDVMVRLYWAGVESRFVATRVQYPQAGKSNYRMVRDNARMTWLHARLLAGMTRRIPPLLKRNVARGRARHWARIGESGSLLGLRVIGFIDARLGRGAALFVLWPVTAWFFVTHHRARRASRRFLFAAGAAVSRRNQFRHLWSFAVSILDKVAAWRDPEAIPIHWASRETLSRAVAGGRGVMLLSAHVGNLELARAAASEIPGVCINALVYSSNARKVKAMLERTTDKSRFRLIEVDTIGADTACLLREKIDAGEIVVIVGDRTPVSANSPVIEAEFLGEPAPLPIGPYVLAHVLECPVYLLFCMHEAAGYNVYMEPFADRVRLPRTGRGAATAYWADRFAARLADYARRFPLQWYNFYDFWGEKTVSARGTGERSFARQSGNGRRDAPTPDQQARNESGARV